MCTGCFFFCEVSVQIFAHLKNSVVFLLLSCKDPLYILDTSLLLFISIDRNRWGYLYIFTIYTYLSLSISIYHPSIYSYIHPFIYLFYGLPFYYFSDVLWKAQVLNFDKIPFFYYYIIISLWSMFSVFYETYPKIMSIFTFFLETL